MKKQILLVLAFLITDRALADTPIGMTNQNVLYVARNGNDATGKRNRLDLPYLSITAAKNASQSADLIYVFPGNYNETDLASTNLNYYFAPGAIVNYTGSNRPAIFDDYGGAITLNVDGMGEFIYQSTVKAEARSTILVTNPLSRVSIRCKSAQCLMGAGGPADLPRAIGILNCSNFVFSGDLILSDYGAGVFWSGGDDIHINAKTISAPPGLYSIWDDTVGSSAINMYVDSDVILGEILVESSNPNAASWITTRLNTSQDFNFVMDGLSKLYITAQKIFQTNHLAIGLVNSGKVWLQADKISSNGSFLTNKGGVVDITAQQFEDNGMDHPAFETSGGTTIIHGGRMLTTNVCLFHGGGISRLENMTLDSSVGSSNSIIVAGDGLTLKNCWITAHDGVEAIEVLHPKAINIDGTLTVNTAPGTNATFMIGSLIVTAGAGSPEGLITASWGSRYTQVGSANRWVKDSFGGNTGWVLKK
jgi:hypothetical protein